MNCVIIDDEPLAVDVIETYIEQLDNMNLVAVCNNPLEAVNILSKHQVDLVFLDIEMPHLSGIDLVKTITYMPQFIFTTAYPQYALEGFNLNAVDYLVKPIPFQRFIQAVSKARERFELEQAKPAQISPESIQNNPVNDFIFIKSEHQNVRIEINNITHIQGLKDYIKIYTKTSSKPVLTISNFKNIMQKLPQEQFMRVHRSFVVNINCITTLQKTKLLVDETRIPIGETYKEEVLKRLGVD